MSTPNFLDEALNFAIEEEKAAAAFYLTLAAQAPGAETRAALQQFAREEQQHEARLRRIQTKGIPPTGSGAPVPDLKIADYMVKLEPGVVQTYRDLLVLAMQKELAAMRLYTALADTTSDPDLQAVFHQLAQEEAKHKLRFETEYDNLMVEG